MIREADPPSLPPTAAVVTVGDELLLGQTIDTNGSWVAGELSRIGFRVVGRWVVGDVDQDIRRAVRAALYAADFVLVTGGLGPTPDDLTRGSVAELLHVSLEVDPDLLARLEERFRIRGYPTLPEGSRAMALVPSMGHALPNPLGAAPGLVMYGEGDRPCILLPGVPSEMKALFRVEVEPFLRAGFGPRLGSAVCRVIHTAGVPESVLMSRIQELLPDDTDGVSLAYLPDTLGVRLRLTARATRGPDEAEERLDDLERRIEPAFAPYRYRAESGDLAEAVGRALLDVGATVAVAESCTGGLVSKRITDIAGSSRYFLGGIVAYANDVKSGILGIPEALLARAGVVSEEVAAAMAEGVARALGSSYGLGITGVAGPDGGSSEKPVGTVCFAIHSPDRAAVRRALFLGNRETVRARAAHAALTLLLRVVERRVP